MSAIATSDQKDIAPLFAFGHGLSYTTFEYADLERSGQRGDRAAAARLADAHQHRRARGERGRAALRRTGSPRTGRRRRKALRGFAKVALAPGESRIVTLALEPRAFARYDDDDDRWIIDPGLANDILIGASAVDIRLQHRITLG